MKKIRNKSENKTYICNVAGIKKYSKLDDMRGKLGDMIISKNRYKSFAYEAPEYVNNPTKAQIREQLLHKEVIKRWQTLSPKEINYIDILACDENIKSMCQPAKISTGYSLFYYLKRNLQEIGEPLTNTVTTFVDYPVQDISHNRVEIKNYRGKPGLRLFLSSEINANTKLIVYATQSIPGGIGKPNKSWYRIISVLDSSFKPGGSITADYLDIFKVIDTTMMSIFFQFKTVDKRSGLASNPGTNIFPLLIKDLS